MNDAIDEDTPSNNEAKDLQIKWTQSELAMAHKFLPILSIMVRRHNLCTAADLLDSANQEIDKFLDRLSLAADPSSALTDDLEIMWEAEAKN